MTTVLRAREPKVRLPYHLWTVAEYQRMAAAGLLDESDHVELIEGELVDMAPIGSRHAVSYTHLDVYKRQSPENLLNKDFPTQLLRKKSSISKYLKKKQPHLRLLFFYEKINISKLATNILKIVTKG